MFLKKDNLEYEFLPAALEIEESPPSPLGRFLIWLIFLIIAITIGWSCIGVVDEVAVARGKTIPEGRIKVIQPKELSIVTNIYVQEGQKVKEGDLLLELDSTNEKVDVDTLEWELTTTKLERDLLLAEIRREDIETVLKSKNLKGDILEYEHSFINARKEEFESKKSGLETIITQREAQLSILKASIPKLEDNLDKLRKEEIELYDLYLNSGTSLEELKDKREEVKTSQNDYDTQKIRIKQAEDSLKEAQINLDSLSKEQLSQTMNQVLENEKRIAEIEGELTKGKEKMRYQKLVSPVDGVIQGLNTTTIGGVVSPAQPIMSIVPEGIPLILEANVQNKDIGFIHDGQLAEIKFDTFPFQRYGTVEGEVVSISPDAFEDEKQGSFYRIKVKPKKTKIFVDGKYVNIAPGMAASVEVKTGKRKIIQFFLDPFRKYVKESFNLR